MLELVKIRAVRVLQEERDGPIVLELAAPLEDIQERMAQGKIEGEGDGA